MITLNTSAPPLSQPFAVSISDIEDAARRLAGQAHVTPLMTSSSLDLLAGRQLFFKCENLQKCGAFKFRGAMTAVNKLTEEQAARGVVTYSSGNHATAVARAAKMRGTRAYVVMPENAPSVKVNAVKRYGAEVYHSSTQIGAREKLGAELVARTGGVLIPPFDHPDVIAGQGTVALEFLTQYGAQFPRLPPLDALVVCVGGGGLMAGCALAAKARQPSIRLFAAEPLLANDMAMSFAAGRRVFLKSPSTTVADGLRTYAPGELTWPIISSLVEAVITVEEHEIRAAMRLLWERLKQVVEPSGAVPLAAVLSKQFRSLPGMARVGVLISGGNLDLDQWKWEAKL